MNPSRPFILRPVATSLLMAAILLAGAVAYYQLPVELMHVICFKPGTWPNCRSRGAVMADATTSGLAPG